MWGCVVVGVAVVAVVVVVAAGGRHEGTGGRRAGGRKGTEAVGVGGVCVTLLASTCQMQPAAWATCAVDCATIAVASFQTGAPAPNLHPHPCSRARPPPPCPNPPAPMLPAPFSHIPPYPPPPRLPAPASLLPPGLTFLPPTLTAASTMKAWPSNTRTSP